MARPRPPDRLERLRDAALRVLAERGLRRARMADVARALGVSPGTLYNWVESKEALFHWVVAVSGEDGPAPAPARLPIPTPAPGATARLLRARLAEETRLPALEAALARRRVDDPRAELAGILEEFWELVARTRRSLTVLERSALDVPELHRLWFAEARRTLFARLADYVARRARRGHFRAVPDPAIAARLLVESITWFARHRHGDADPALLPDDAALRAAVIPLLVAGLVPDPATGGRR